MAGPATILSPTDLRKIANLHVLARQVVEGVCSGLHTSPHKGFSVEFRQHRQYVQGDETRRLDWKVFGKTDRLYIKEYEEETNLRATLLVDASGSMAYAGSGTSKYKYAIQLAACLSYLMLRQADSVGLVTFDKKVREYIPPRSRPSHLQVLLDTLQQTAIGGETELSKVFHQLVPKIHRRGLLIILSDCFGDVPELMKALAHFRHAHHEIIILQIWDPDELEFPFKQWVRFDSLESDTDKRLIDPVQLRATYLENLARFRKELKDGCSRHRIDLVPVTTDKPYAEVLANYLARRMKV
ncbi:MAG: hypothetical protein PCFJNLEI_02451 [Verrucomicrobiae bacterium]|nr:hypothetical protein [Verrucomicrobiae bacterium]